MLHVRPDPQARRQVTPDGIMIFWRDGGGGRREGLMLVGWACPFPECDDRHLDLAVYRVDDTAGDIELDERGRWTVEYDGAREDLALAFSASFDLDEERLEVGWRATPELAAWLGGEVDAEVVAALRVRYRSCRSRSSVLARWLGLRRRPRLGRNEACPCGSGKKYKRCCLGVA